MTKKRCDNVVWLACMLLLTTCISACSAIDDDLKDCPNDVAQYQMSYQLRLVTNMTTELRTQLTTMTELRVANALQTHLANIFSDFAHDVDLSFYETEGNLERLEHKVDIINNNQTTYDLTLPMRRYLHLAVANIADNGEVNLVDDNWSYSSLLLQKEGTVPEGASTGIIDSHTTGLFTARQPMNVIEGISQTFNVRLYMANSAASLVLDPMGLNYTDLKVFTTGFANAFIISDSTYVYNSQSTLVKADKVNTGNELLCYTSVNFPSKDAAPAAIGRRADGASTLWQFKVYLTKTDGTVTETILDINEPLRAGDLKIIKGSLDSDGAVRPYDPTVGVSVTLDWDDGGTYNPDL